MSFLVFSSFGSSVFCFSLLIHGVGFVNIERGSVKLILLFTNKVWNKFNIIEKNWV